MVSNPLSDAYNIYPKSGLWTELSTNFAMFNQKILAPDGGKPVRSIGIGGNDASLLMKFLNIGPTGEYKADGVQSLTEAAKNHLPFIRFNANLYWPADYKKYYVNDQSGFWAAYDSLVQTAARLRVRLIPSIYWNEELYAGYLDVPCDQTYVEGTAANDLLTSFTTKLVSRFRNSETILMWELTNELNLFADIGRDNTGSVGCVTTTDQMVTFTNQLASTIKSIDQTHPIESGYSLPRAGAEHLRECHTPVGGIPASSCWIPDTFDQFSQYLAITYPASINVISIHVYNSPCSTVNGQIVCDQDRFGLTGKNNANIIDYAKAVADKLGKKLFIGEFGDIDPWIQGSCEGKPEDKTAPFSQAVIRETVKLLIGAAIWEWYGPLCSGNPDRALMRIAVGETTFILRVIMEANVLVLTVSYTVLGGGSPSAPVFDFVLAGLLKTYKLTSKPTSLQVDLSSSWSVTPNPLRGSSGTERWQVQDPSTLSGTASSSATLVFTFIHQYLPKLSYSVVGGGSPSAPFFQANQFDSLTQIPLTTSATGYWFDAGSPWSVGPNPLTGSGPSEQWVTTQKTNGKITGGGTLALKFQHQFYLTMVANPSAAGSVTPTSNWYNAGLKVTIKATAKTGHKFLNWTGTGSGSYSGASSSKTITINSAITETANFT